jgi:uncharacterized protein YkwD
LTPTVTLTPVLPIGTPAYLPFVSYNEPPTATPTPTPTATPTPTPTPEWFIYLNQLRAVAELPPVANNPDWSQDSWEHSRYMVKNNDITHYQDETNEWYTPGGYDAGRYGNIYGSGWTSTPDKTAINYWMTAPFHAVPILNPRLHTVGFGSYRENIGWLKMGATLDVRRGRDTVVPPGIVYPLMYPVPGGETWLTEFRGGEWPDPLPHCGYNVPHPQIPQVGAPIIIQMGTGSFTPNVTDHSLYLGDEPLEHCVFDETNFTHETDPAYPAQQNSGRLILNVQDAIVMLPQAPLLVGQTYTVSFTVNDIVYEWSFSVIPPPTQIQNWPDSFDYWIGAERDYYSSRFFWRDFPRRFSDR